MGRKRALLAVGLAIVGAAPLGLWLAADGTHASARASSSPSPSPPPSPRGTSPFEPDAPLCAPRRVERPASGLLAPRSEPSGAPAPVSSASRGGEVTVEEGARCVAGYLAAADRGADVLALAAAIAQDPDMAARIEAEARRLLAEREPALRARGVLVLAGLGVLDAAAWERAVAAEADAGARAAILTSPPLGRDARGDALVRTALLDAARRDPAPEVRAAAVRALPSGLTAEQVHVLTQVLAADPDPRVRLVAAQYFRGARLAEPAVVRGLLAAANEQDPEVRRASAVALFRIEEASPGALASAGGSLESLHRSLAEVDPDRG